MVNSRIGLAGSEAASEPPVPRPPWHRALSRTQFWTVHCKKGVTIFLSPVLVVLVVFDFPWGLEHPGVSLPGGGGVFLSCIVLKHLSQMARFPLFTDFFSNCDFSRILCTDYYVCNKTYSLKCKKIKIRRKVWDEKNNMRRIRREEQEVKNNKGWMRSIWKEE